MTVRGWLSYHITVPAPLEPFMVECLWPVLDRDTQPDGPVRRFFFIRYSDPDLQLRLRLRLRDGVPSATMRMRLESCVREYLARAGRPDLAYRVEERPYSRVALYFGEALPSVYAELLNEATSRLALRLLRGPGGDRWSRRWLALAAILFLLQRRAAADTNDLCGMLSASRDFAEHTARTHGFGDAGRSAPISGDADASLLDAIDAIHVQLDDDGELMRIGRLLRRARRVLPNGRFVAIHALHLLCNKMGLSPHEEYRLMTALDRLAPAALARLARVSVTRNVS
jgi:thiopeptide-type bacteriocin biosynthesis protein